MDDVKVAEKNPRSFIKKKKIFHKYLFNFFITINEKYKETFPERFTLL